VLLVFATKGLLSICIYLLAASLAYHFLFIQHTLFFFDFFLSFNSLTMYHQYNTNYVSMSRENANNAQSLGRPASMPSLYPSSKDEYHRSSLDNSDYWQNNHNSSSSSSSSGWNHNRHGENITSSSSSSPPSTLTSTTMDNINRSTSMPSIEKYTSPTSPTAMPTGYNSPYFVSPTTAHNTAGI
jgi:hypothetical protein